MINFKKVRFIKSAPSLLDAPKDERFSIMFIGRSNVGKSSLINALVGQKIAFSSKKAGKTKLLNYFLIDESFYLIDPPGYGSTIYANISTINFAKMMEDYLKENHKKALVLLLDLRHKVDEGDAKFIKYLQNSGVPLIYVMTKCDLMNQSELSKARRYAGELGIIDPIIYKQDKNSLEEIKKRISSIL